MHAIYTRSEGKPNLLLLLIASVVSCFEKISVNGRPHQIMQPPLTEAELIQAEESSGVTARDGGRRFPKARASRRDSNQGHRPRCGDAFLRARPYSHRQTLAMSAPALSGRARRPPRVTRAGFPSGESDSYVRHGAERLDLSVTFLVGRVRSGDERSAHLRTVPARFDSEAARFCGVHATRGKICHWGVSLSERSAFRVSAGFRSAVKSEAMAL